jgi:hypothetical protein
MRRNNHHRGDEGMLAILDFPTSRDTALMTRETFVC